MKIIPLNSGLEIVKVKMPNKPYIAKAYENYKIHQYPEDIKNTNTYSFILWALDMLGVNSKEGGEGHHAAILEFVNHALDGYTYQELKLAVLMHVKGSLGTMVTQQLNAVVLGKIMAKYNDIKMERLNSYMREKKRIEQENNQPKLTLEEEIKLVTQGVKKCYYETLENKKVPYGYSWVYEYLIDKLKILKVTKKEKIKEYNIQKKKLIAETKVKAQASEVAKTIKLLEEKRSSKVIVAAQSSLLKKLFQKGEKAQGREGFIEKLVLKIKTKENKHN